MKRFTLFFMAFSFLSLFSCSSPKLQIRADQLIAYHFQENGTMAQPNVSISVGLNPDTTACLVKVLNMDDYPVWNIYKVDPALLDELDKIIQEHRMAEYEPYYKTEFDVLDGTSWDFSAQYANKKTIESRGLEAGPKDNGLELINSLIEETIKQSKLVKTVQWGDDE